MVMKFSGRFLFRFEIMLFFFHKKIVSKLTLIDLLEIKLTHEEYLTTKTENEPLGIIAEKKLLLL